MRFISLALALLIVLVHAELWFGNSGVPRMLELQAKLERQKAVNDEARHRNEQLAAEVSDLAEGLEMVEEKEAIEKFGSSDSGASLGDILGAALREKAQKE